MKTSLKQLGAIQKSAITIVSNAVIALAMGLMHYSNVGADPITVLIGGISHSLSVSVGAASTILSASFFVFVLLFNRKQIKPATFLCVITLGPFMDAALWLITRIVPQNLPFIVRLIESAVSSCVLGLAIGFYLSLDFGASPTDGMMLWFHKVLHLNYRYCTWVFYGISLIIGVILGGVFGIGTILSLLLVGTCSNYMLKKLGSN